MYWADKIAKSIVESGKFKPFWVDDMATPSGYPHIGSLRGPLVHDQIFNSLKDAGEDVTFSFVINDFDPIDGLPEELQERFSKYLGFPLKSVPSPEEGFDSFADFFAEDYKKVLKGLGLDPKYLSSWEMYHQGKFDEVIREALDNASEIQEIYHQVSGSEKREKGWLPLQVICQHCGKLGTTRVYEWDGKEVSYKCEPDMVKWAQGCGLEGRMSPFGGNGKLPWKVDWPAHWKVIGVTIEGAGKDHSVAGGSRDIAREICKEVFHIEEPFNLPYEFIQIGGKKMASSKGLGLKARDLTQILPAEVGRFLFTRTDYRQAVEFDPINSMTIPDLLDEYDRCFMAYTEGGDSDLARAFEMSQINSLPEKEKLFLPRFRDVANYLQTSPDNLEQKFEEQKGSPLNEKEKGLLEERKKYAKVWLERYAPEDYKFQMGEFEVGSLDEEEKKFLKGVIDLVNKDLGGEELQMEIYKLAQAQGIQTKKAFSSLYKVLIGKEFGPKAGVLLASNPKDKILERLEEAVK